SRKVRKLARKSSCSSSNSARLICAPDRSASSPTSGHAPIAAPRQECGKGASNKTADEASRDQERRAPPRHRHQRAPEPLEVHTGAVRRVLTLAEGRRA